MSDNYQEEVPLLRKLLRTESFRFVIITYNHYSLVTRLKEEINSLFPNRKIQSVDAEKIDFSQLFQTYKNLQSGILFVDNFEDIIRLRTNSLGEETPELAKDNARRRGITAGLNLRRDKLSKYPIALIVFISSATKELYTRTLMERMPDLWSFRSLVLELEREIEVETLPLRGVDTQFEEKILLDSPTEAMEKEIRRLEELLKDTPLEEVAYRSTLYRQLTDKLSEAGYYDRAIIYLEEWLENSLEENKGIVLYKLGRNAVDKGDLPLALSNFEKLRKFCKQKLFENPQDLSLKSNLGVVYSCLGKTYSLLGDLKKAFKFYKLDLKITNELYRGNPKNIKFKNDLGISYCRLGEISSLLDDLKNALMYFKKYGKLMEELYIAQPERLDFRHNLAVAYMNTGDTYIALNNIEKALEFFELDFKVTKELYDNFPDNIDYKNNLAISYEKLGKTYNMLGNFQKALAFFEKEVSLFEELESSHPQNVKFKDGLAISYCKLAEIKESANQLSDAISLFKQAEIIWLELTKLAPDYVSFKEHLQSVKSEIARLKS
jgi:tetratricopeptide (TPR) repeat protein